jgi:hypothetical protein
MRTTKPAAPGIDLQKVKAIRQGIKAYVCTCCIRSGHVQSSLIRLSPQFKISKPHSSGKECGFLFLPQPVIRQRLLQFRWTPPGSALTSTADLAGGACGKRRLQIR